MSAKILSFCVKLIAKKVGIQMKLGFIGTGVMGTGIIINLLKANYPVVVYNRTKAHAQTVIDRGAVWADTPQAVAEQANIVFSMVGYPQDVEQVYFGKQGLFKSAKSHSYFIDMTTSTPTLAKKIAELGARDHLHILDAPVSGGDIGAKKGTLTIMVGGKRSDYEQLRTIFEVIGTKIHYFGPAGSGQHAKMANQIMIAGTMTGLTEMLVYAQAAHLDLNQLLDAVGTGSGANWSLSNYGPRILAGDYAPGFYTKHFLKDLRIALDEAKRLHLNLPATTLAEKLYAEMSEKGLGNSGTQALIKLYQSTK